MSKEAITQIEKLAYMKQFTKFILKDGSTELTDISLDEYYAFTKEFCPKLKAGFRAYYLHHGSRYENFLSNLHINEVNIGRQYQNGVSAILQVFNNKLTSKATVAILTFSKLMLNDCVKRGLEDFTDSIVEWSCRIFEKNIVDSETTVDWKVVLAHLERDSTEKPDEENSSNIIFVKCLLAITVGCLLIGVVVR